MAEVNAARFEIREATQADNDALLELTRATPMPGTISLRVDRDPDFFRLLRLRGDTTVFVATEGTQVAGCISVAVRRAFIAGRLEAVGYAGDLKVHPRFAGNRLVPRLVRAGVEHFRSKGIDLLLSIVADGNERALSLFDTGLGNPRTLSAGRFVVEELLATPFEPRPGPYRIGVAGPEDARRISALLAGMQRNREFAPAHTQDHPDSRVLVARAGGEVVATLTLFDPSKVKRNVLIAAPALVRAVLALIRAAITPFRKFPVPQIGDAVRVLYAVQCAHAEGHEAALRSLVKQARFDAYLKHCTFVVVGLHERDPLRAIVQGIPRFTFIARAFVTSLESSSRLDEVASGVPYEDFALV